MISAKTRVGTTLAQSMVMARDRFARQLTLMLASALITTTTLSGCLVTEPIDVPREENLPPSIVSAPSAVTLPIPTDLGSIVSIDLDRDTPVDGPGEALFPVEVRDPNLDQALFYRLFVDFDPELNRSPAIDNNRIEPGSGLTRELDLTVPFTALGAPGRCHKLELRVSSAFVDSFPQYDAVDPQDLAVAIWWVRLTDEVRPTVDLSTCP